MTGSIDDQKTAFDTIYTCEDRDRWSFHDTDDVLIRYLRDRRIRIAIAHLKKVTNNHDLGRWTALVICGGVGGEGTLLANLGFRETTVSDFSESALKICSARDPRLQTRVINAEKVDAPDNSFDVVLVQDGLHHLPRPVSGYTEMLRVARKAAIVIEPHTGLIANMIGTEWEQHGDCINYVFRWNKQLLTQVTRSVLLKSRYDARVIRTWDHNVVMGKVARMVGGGRFGLFVVRGCYGVLNCCFGWFGNMFIGVVVKNPRPDTPQTS